jgi:hypothetical protein
MSNSFFLFCLLCSNKQMTVSIPATTVRSKFLKTLPVGSIYKDPRNEYTYEIQERCINSINSTLSKVAVPYFGSTEPVIVDVPEKHMKMINPVRANINQSLKQKIVLLEETVNRLQSELLTDKGSNAVINEKEPQKDSLLDKIKQLMNGKEYYKNGGEFFYVDNSLVYYSRSSDGKENIKKIKKDIMKGDLDMIKELTDNQSAIKKRFFKYLCKGKLDEKVINLKKR